MEENQPNRLTGMKSNIIENLQDRIVSIIDPYIPADGKIAIVDFPDIRNCGDSAIWVGEIKYLKSRHGISPAYVSRMADLDPNELRRKLPSGPIMIHGGGNLGDIWPGHQRFREKVIREFKDRQIIQFPQSIHFNDRSGIDTFAKIVDEHGNTVLLLRDEASLEIARKHFNCESFLCPDMAFFIGPRQSQEPNCKVSAVLRKDKEQKRHDGSEANLRDMGIPVDDWIFGESKMSIRMTKLLGYARACLKGELSRAKLEMFNAAAGHRLNRGLNLISKGSVVITDRLHVHICSLLLGKKHAVLDNNYRKIGNFIDAFTHQSDLVYRARDLNDAIEWAKNQTA